MWVYPRTEKNGYMVAQTAGIVKGAFKDVMQYMTYIVFMLYIPPPEPFYLITGSCTFDHLHPTPPCPTPSLSFYVFGFFRFHV